MSVLYSKKTIAVFFLLLLSGSVLLNALVVDDVEEGRHVAKGGAKKGGRKGRKTASDYLADAMDIVSAFGGGAVEGVIRELTDNLTQTMGVLKSLAKGDVIDSINFTIRSALSSLSEAARQVAAKNDAADTVQSSDFGEFMDAFKSTLVSRCRSKAGFSPLVLPQLQAALPLLLQSVTELYGNVVSSVGFGVTFGMLTQGTSLLSLLERPQYVSADTFRSFTDFPAEIKHQLETVFDEVVGQYIDPAQLDMMFGMAKMYAANFASQRAEHEEL